MRTDPTDTGGLFTGRRPGTRPVHYRSEPRPGSRGRRRADGALAALMLVAMTAVNLCFWGPIPVAGLWIGGRTQHLTGSVGLALLCAFVFIVGLLLGGLVLLKRLDAAWIVVRRAAGHDQRDGALTRIFATTCALGATGFAIWLIFFSGASLVPVGISF